MPATRLAEVTTAFLISLALLSSCAAQETEAELTEIAVATEEALSVDDFNAIAVASCDRAFEQGVEELTLSGNYRQVMIPKEAAVDGYIAAWEDIESDDVGLIWEADAFLSCAPAMTISLAQEAGEEPVWEITSSSSGYTVFQDFGEYGTQTIEFEVADGNFVAANIIDGEEFVISYEPNLEQALNLISTAVTEFEQ